MSIHFNVGEILNAILHRHEPQLPPLSTAQLLLIECYRSGQIEESAWQEHLDEDSDLAAYFREPVKGVAVH
jgi:hypothetical protein